MNMLLYIIFIQLGGFVMGAIVFVGANSDIAQATLLLLAEQEKNDIILLTRDPSLLPPACQERYTCHPCDATDADAVCSVFESICQTHSITGVVNFCGSILLKSAAALTPEDWRSTIRINLDTAFNVCHAVAKWKKKDVGIVLFSTAAASLGLPNHEAIAAAKSGVEGLSKSVAATYAAQKVRCNVIAPGLIQTKLAAPITKSKNGRALSESLHALGRLGEPSDIARMLVFLLDESNNWITGETFRVDGGLSTTKGYPMGG